MSKPGNTPHTFVRTQRWTVALLAGAALLLAACSSPEEKAQGFYQKGSQYLSGGDLVKARIEFQNALQINPNLVPALTGLADIAERKAEWQQLFALLSKVAELDPKRLDTQLKLGKLLLAANQLDKALAASDAALALAPDDLDARSLRAALLFRLEDTKAAVALARQVLEKDPKHLDALVVLASERLAAGDGEGAVTFLDQGLVNDERNVTLQLIRVQALERMARLETAEEALRKLMGFYPDNKAFRTILAQFYVLHKKTDQAEAVYRGTAQMHPKDNQAKLDVVRFLNTTKGAPAAAAELERLVAEEAGNHELRLALAALRQTMGQRDVAAQLYRDVIARAGQDDAALRARNALTADLLARGDKTAAQAMLADTLAQDARNEQALLFRAGIHMDEARLEDAVADLRTVLRDVPNSARAMALLGKVHELQGSRDLAQDQYARSFQAGKQVSPNFGMAYAEFLMRVGRARQAEDVLREVLGASPGHVPALRLLAQAHLATGNMTAAQAVADEVAGMAGQAVAANQIRGAVFAARKNFDNSIAAYRKAYDAAPTEVQPMVALVRGYLAAGKPREAVAFMDSVLKASPSNVAARVLLGQLHQQAGNTDAARDALEGALAQDPKAVPAYLGLVALRVQQGQLAEAEAVLDRGLKAVPGNFEMRLSRAGVLEGMNRIEDAIVQYEGLIKERPNADVVINNLASLLADHRDDKASHERAFGLAQRLRNSEVPQFMDTLGWASHKVGKNEDAVALLKRAADQLPELAVVHYHYGQTQLAMNNRKLAKESLQRSIDLAKGQPFPQADEARATLQGL